MFRCHMLYWVFWLSISPWAGADDWFHNIEQQAAQAFEQQDYSKAATLFQDPYQQGVSLYRAGKYQQAADAFAQVDRPAIKENARYNLGNAYFQQGDYEKAIAAYQAVLANNPKHADAKHNLALAQQQLAQQNASNTQKSDQDAQQADNPASEQQSNQTQSSSQASNEQNIQQTADQSPSSEKQPSPAAEQQQSNRAESSENTAATQAQNEFSDSETEQTQPYQPPKDRSTTQTDVSAMKQKPAETGTEAAATSTATPSEKEEANRAAATTTENPAAATGTPTSEQAETEVMADALLGRIVENPQKLLQGQFYIDAYNARVNEPDKPW